MAQNQHAADPNFGGLIADPAALQAFFDRHAPGTGGRIAVDRVDGGASNVLFKVTRGAEAFALRRPPATANDPTSNNMARELQLMRALSGTGVRHARMVAGCIDASIVGAPFIVMEWVDGFTPVDPMPEPFSSDPTTRRRMGFEAVEALSEVANVEWKEAGLRDFGRPDGFLERQVDRWLGQLSRYQTRELPHLARLADWLRANRPETQRIGLIHGDYSFANIMFAPGGPARLAAIVDWESATIGDPLLDLGHLLSSWEDETSGPTWASFTDFRRGFPSRSEAAARYTELTGLSTERLDFYIALALFKLAIIMEGAYARFAAGKSDLAQHARMETVVPAMIEQAARTARLV